MRRAVAPTNGRPHQPGDGCSPISRRRGRRPWLPSRAKSRLMRFSKPAAKLPPFPWNRPRDRLRQREGSTMRRREFIAGLGSTSPWPLTARAQQAAMPVIGYLGTGFADDDLKNFTVPFLQGLKETGYVEGQNVAIEYRWAENLPALAADLVRRRVA